MISVDRFLKISLMVMARSKGLIYFLMAFFQTVCLYSAVGCTGEPQPDGTQSSSWVSEFTLSRTEIAFEWAGGRMYVDVTGPDGWTASVTDGDDWCSVTRESDTRLTVAASRNPGDGRTAAVTLSAGSEEAEITVFQKANDAVVEQDVMPENEMYDVEIYRNGEWERLFVHNARVSDYAANPEAGYTQYDMGFVMFTDDFSEPVKVRVTRNEPFSEVRIRPLSYGIDIDSMNGQSVEFAIDSPERKVSVEFDGDRMRNLFILPDLPDTERPAGADVMYYGPGVHNVGLISPKSGQTVYIDEGAVVLARVKAENADNLTIAGRGILCASQENHGDGRLPQMEFLNCDNLKIEGIMLRGTPNWTIKITGSTGVHIDNIKEIGWIMNSDGMDFICCRNVLVENTFQRNYDDNVTIKAFNATPEYVASHTAPDGSYTDGNIWTVIALTQFDVYDIEVRNCVFWADKAHNMVVGPESRGIPFSDIRFHDNIVLENRQDDSVYPGTMAVMIADNGTFSDITFENIIVEDINGGKVICVHFANAWAFDSLYGQWARNITFRNISYTGTRATKSWIRGLNSTQTIDGLTVDGFTVNEQPVTDTDGPYLEINGYVKNVTIQ